MSVIRSLLYRVVQLIIFSLEMLSDGVSEHQILKIFLGGHAPRSL